LTGEFWSARGTGAPTQDLRHISWFRAEHHQFPRQEIDRNSLTRYLR